MIVGGALATLDLILGVGVRTGWTAPGEGALSCQLGLSVFLMSQNFTMPSPAPVKETHNIEKHKTIKYAALLLCKSFLAYKYMHVCMAFSSYSTGRQTEPSTCFSQPEVFLPTDSNRL